MGSYLETSLQSFVDQQHLFREQMRNFMGKNPLTMISDLTERNLAIWRSMNEHFYRFQRAEADKNIDPENFDQETNEKNEE
jgi:polyhydroxyalkanoate synthesis regulator protein